jgi:hypothetical protein
MNHLEQRILQPDYDKLSMIQGGYWNFAPFVLQERRRFLLWTYWRTVKVGDTTDAMPPYLKPVLYP